MLKFDLEKRDRDLKEEARLLIEKARDGYTPNISDEAILEEIFRQLEEIGEEASFSHYNGQWTMANGQRTK